MGSSETEHLNLIMHGLFVDSGLCKNQPGSTSTLLKNQNTTDFASNASAVSTPTLLTSLQLLSNDSQLPACLLRTFKCLLRTFLGQKLIFYQE